jgi:hypothetical protein
MRSVPPKAQTAPHRGRLSAVRRGAGAFAGRAGRAPPFWRALVQAHRAFREPQNYSPATVNQRFSAMRKLAVEAAANGLLRGRHRIAPGAWHQATRRAHGKLAQARGDAGALPDWPAATRSRACATAPPSVCWWAAVCVVPRRLPSPSSTSSSARAAG